jgi:opacity protein-like surface antigen
MLGFTFISKARPRARSRGFGAAALILVALLALPVSAFAEDPPGRAATPEEDDFSGSPYTDYGQFNNQEAEEEADTLFFQYGRFFGIGFGVGTNQALGNRGQLWSGGFPFIELKLHYWFDFNFALALDVFSVSHFYEDPEASIGRQDVSLVQLGLNLRYYFETKNLSSTISFANPYVMASVGSYTKTETSTQVAVPDDDSSIGFSVGAGLEFALSPKKTYLQFEGRMHLATFKDTYTERFAADGLDDLTGPFLTLAAQIMFTW